MVAMHIKSTDKRGEGHRGKDSRGVQVSVDRVEMNLQTENNILTCITVDRVQFGGSEFEN